MLDMKKYYNIFLRKGKIEHLIKCYSKIPRLFFSQRCWINNNKKNPLLFALMSIFVPLPFVFANNKTEFFHAKPSIYQSNVGMLFFGIMII
jgi:hypothetical protein